MALTQVTKSGITADAIDATKIADNAVDSEHIAADSIDAEHYAAGSVDATALGADAVTAAKIGDDVLNSEHYAATSIDNEHLADDAVDSDELAAGSVDTAHLSADCVTAAKIADDVINSEHYAAASIDNEHLADDAVGVAELSATGTASSSTFLRGDNAWAAAGGNLKIVTALTHNNGNAAITESAGNNKTTGSGFNITTGSETNRILFQISYFAMNYDAGGPSPYGHTSVYFHDSMDNAETPTGSVITYESSYFGMYLFTGSTARHDIYHNNTIHGMATVSPSTEYFIQLCARKGQYGNYINIDKVKGYIMEYAQ